VVGSVEGPAAPRDIHVSLPRPLNRTNSPNLESIPTPTLEQANPLIVATTLASSDPSSSNYYPYPRSTIRRSTTPVITSSPSTSQNPDPTPSSLVNTTGSSAVSGLQPEQKDLPTSRALKPGDVLFWHHLSRCGEIPGVEDDHRARSKPLTRSGISPCPSLDGTHLQRKGKNLGRVVFGR
jgi:hypothetical protein